MSMSPEDVAAMFDLPPLPEVSTSAEEAAAALEAAEAALAVELAASMDPDGFADDAPESRGSVRVPASWPARMGLPDGRVIGLTIRNVSESGVGVTGDEHLPADTIVDFEMTVPSLDAGGTALAVKGTIRTTYTVVHGAQILCGGTWVQMSAAGMELVNQWIARLRP